MAGKHTSPNPENGTSTVVHVVEKMRNGIGAHQNQVFELANGAVGAIKSAADDADGSHSVSTEQEPFAEHGHTERPKPEAVSHKKGDKPSKPKGLSKTQLMNKMYSLPAPVRTFPLPFFTPSNPLSLLQIVYVWVSQTIAPPSSHPKPLFQAWYSPENMSVHVTDHKTIRALWERGFYGKGTLSRSDPSWLDREKRKRGARAQQTSEEVTRKRRVERQQLKWERARKEREAIEQTRLREKQEALDRRTRSWASPTGPLELLALPNSTKELEAALFDAQAIEAIDMDDEGYGSAPTDVTNDILDSSICEVAVVLSMADGAIDEIRTVEQLDLSPDVQRSRSPKSVRFSPTVEQTTFMRNEPPSPDLAHMVPDQLDEPDNIIEDQEHLQLTLEEAFFLSFGFGALQILDPNNKAPMSNEDLFSVCRRSSVFDPATYVKSPDDSFMISYVVYHHFRSLGWVVRTGIKFGVDYLLYNRGPPFTHAEFAITVIPAYSDPYWSKDAETQAHVARKTKGVWSWLHCVNRVNTQVKKTLVLVYVDVPPPLTSDEEAGSGIMDELARYRVREIVLKRWSANRSRD